MGECEYRLDVSNAFGEGYTMEDALMECWHITTWLLLRTVANWGFFS